MKTSLIGRFTIRQIFIMLTAVISLLMATIVLIAMALERSDAELNAANETAMCPSSWPPSCARVRTT
ncbi:hypothetical protein [uncultured Herbaspirillum sp.]|uniref:hypothetical protein n=1 Tax=uncultured Herbaspirillum sp. TaxID=160236 RepID=UPI00258FAFBD|nr:hypothetical protein [uncultured Herbaspirillum sp.]